MVNIQDIRESQPDLAFQLTKIPVFELIDHYDRYGYRGEIFVKTEVMYDDEYEDYWTTAAAASLAHARLRKEYAHSQRLADTIPETSKRDLLKDACAHIREWKDPKCTPLVEAVCALHAADPAEERHFSQALTVYETLQSVLVARDAFLEHHRLNDTQAEPTLSHFFSDVSCRQYDTWINHLVRGDVDIGTYLEVVKSNHERKAKEQQAYKKKLKRQKAGQRRRRLAGEHVESLCTALDCDRYVPVGCINITCSLHCQGSCPLHEGHHSDTSDGSVASSYDSSE